MTQLCQPHMTTMHHGCHASRRRQVPCICTVMCRTLAPASILSTASFAGGAAVRSVKQQPSLQRSDGQSGLQPWLHRRPSSSRLRRAPASWRRPPPTPLLCGTPLQPAGPWRCTASASWAPVTSLRSRRPSPPPRRFRQPACRLRPFPRQGSHLQPLGRCQAVYRRGCRQYSRSRRQWRTPSRPRGR